jgi:hypothetical protein
MQRRWSMQNKKLMVGIETMCDAGGWQQLKTLRAVDPRFRGCRIKEIFQAEPELVKLVNGSSGIFKLTYEPGDFYSAPTTDEYLAAEKRRKFGFRYQKIGPLKAQRIEKITALDAKRMVTQFWKAYPEVREWVLKLQTKADIAWVNKRNNKK